ncbi:MAG TPA: hypothetical protein VJ464_24490 [Blastocatellia bacterium]|nr:hypothetical protein [Blastocatellia bacterium]
MSRTLSVPLAIVLCLLLAPAAAAQSRQKANAKANAPTPPKATAPASQASRTDTDASLPDLEIKANVTVRELKFEQVGNAKVEFPGKPERVTVNEAERQNLPRPVQPGVTYRDIGVRLVITSAFADIDRIVSEALGETQAPKEQVEKKPADAKPPQENLPPKTPPQKSSRKP